MTECCGLLGLEFAELYEFWIVAHTIIGEGARSKVVSARPIQDGNNLTISSHNISNTLLSIQPRPPSPASLPPSTTPTVRASACPAAQWADPRLGSPGLSTINWSLLIRTTRYSGEGECNVVKRIYLETLIEEGFNLSEMTGFTFLSG